MSKCKVMVSACLLGLKCRYDGAAKANLELVGLALAEFELVPVCPEYLGDLPVPRLPAEIQNGDGAAVLAGKAVVLTRQGNDYTPQFCTGAVKTWEFYREVRPELVVLKAHSPSCGVGLIYDGSFSGKLCPGDGVTAALLRENGVVLYTEVNFQTALTIQARGGRRKWFES
jgi:uncharacterized protein YbbK (DUF523 family)